MSARHKLPIVLAHGFARFDILLVILKKELNLPDNPLEDQFHYFRGIKTHLEARGFKVFQPNQDFAGRVDLRAEQLKDRVNEILAATGAAKVHLIAHSMGGLDARHMIVDKNMAGKVASLTTIGSPHFGTILADHVVSLGGSTIVDRLRQFINLDLNGFLDLTIEACENFNRRAEDFEAKNDVFYQTYASTQSFPLVFAPLLLSWTFIQGHAGRNDGLVPLASQQWKRELVAGDGSRKIVSQKEFPFPADHLNQVGWWDPQEANSASKFFKSRIKQAMEYENKVRNVYLEIVENL